MAALVLTARFYSTVDLPRSDRMVAAEIAANILQAAGIDLQWLDCSARTSSGARVTKAICLTPAATGDVIVRFMSSPASTTGSGRAGADPLGDAYVDTAAATGSLATVYVDRVDVMARAAGVDAGTLLGRVAAHEIGHLLLGTSAHRSAGLMRAEWSTTLVQRRIANEWRFSRPDAAAAREGVVRRAMTVSDAAGASTAAVVPCAAPMSRRLPALCPSCPACQTALPADRLPFHLLVEPRF